MVLVTLTFTRAALMTDTASIRGWRGWFTHHQLHLRSSFLRLRQLRKVWGCKVTGLISRVRSPYSSLAGCRLHIWGRATQRPAQQKSIRSVWNYNWVLLNRHALNGGWCFFGLPSPAWLPRSVKFCMMHKTSGLSTFTMHFHMHDTVWIPLMASKHRHCFARASISCRKLGTRLWQDGG